MTFLRDWMLPIAIVLGITVAAVYEAVPALHRYGPVGRVIVADGQRLVIAILLFCQFVRISPHDVRPQRWHRWILLFQVLSFVACALLARSLPHGGARILVECAMLCLICPTASAAGVITEKLGGQLAGTVTYLVMINLVGTLLIPSVIPMVQPAADLGFWAYVLRIAAKIFPVLILPAVLAWTIRYTMPRLQRLLMRLSAHSFYVWGVGLTFAMILATHSLLRSHLGAWTITGIVLVSSLSCLLQFLFGRWAGRASAGADTAAAGAVDAARAGAAGAGAAATAARADALGADAGTRAGAGSGDARVAGAVDAARAGAAGAGADTAAAGAVDAARAGAAGAGADTAATRAVDAARAGAAGAGADTAAAGAVDAARAGAAGAGADTAAAGAVNAARAVDAARAGAAGAGAAAAAARADALGADAGTRAGGGSGDACVAGAVDAARAGAAGAGAARTGDAAHTTACAAAVSAAERRATALTAGQTLGQKNTGFLIWLGYTYLTPVTSVAGGLYAIWQNLFNAWELYEARHHAGTAA